MFGPGPSENWRKCAVLILTIRRDGKKWVREKLDDKHLDVIISPWILLTFRTSSESSQIKYLSYLVQQM
jgi:hypothetical protein